MCRVLAFLLDHSQLVIFITVVAIHQDLFLVKEILILLVHLRVVFAFAATHVLAALVIDGSVIVGVSLVPVYPLVFAHVGHVLQLHASAIVAVILLT